MSRIYFHTPTIAAGVHGSERAHFGTFCNDLAWLLLSREDKRLLSRLFPPDHYVHTASNFAQSARVALAVGDDGLRLNGRRIDTFTMALNTALTLGGDDVKLAARIHGQCELHCWVNGQNRRWLAGIVQRGVDSGFYRSGMGWDAVIDLLLAEDSPSVVLSYSGSDWFPNSVVAGIDNNAWSELSMDDKWRLALDGLSATHGLELTPDGWADYRFRDSYTAFDLIRDLGKGS